MVRCLVVVVLLLQLSSPGVAGVAITGESPSRIQVEIEDAPVATVLENLRERFGFELEGVEKASSADEALTLTVTGSLKDVLGRLLRNWNYVIVSSQTGEGIERVVILNASHGAAPPVPPKSDDPDDPMKQFTGE